MVEPQPSKLMTRVRFPLPAPSFVSLPPLIVYSIRRTPSALDVSFAFL